MQQPFFLTIPFSLRGAIDAAATAPVTGSRCAGSRNSLFPRIVVLLFIIATMFTACTERRQDLQPLQARLDSMEQRLGHTYTPGFGELMLNIQIHHSKLWFAGIKGNWELATYNESLIRSAFRKIRIYHPGDPNTAATAMIDTPLDSIATAIRLKNAAAFGRSFRMLTVACNNCHAVTKHAFNVIQIPQTEPIGNQDFSLTSTQHH